MRSRSILLILLFGLGIGLIAVHAQDVTPEATVEASAEVTPEAPQVVHHVRLLYLSTDGPVLVPYLNGEPSAIQLLDAPAVSGWIDIPGGTTLSLIPLGEAQSSAVVGPLNLDDQTANWTTIVILGSPANTGLQAFAINENYTTIPDGCARVTVLHALEGGPPVDVSLDDGTLLASSLMFPLGAAEQANVEPMSDAAAELFNDCLSDGQGIGEAASAEATVEAGVVNTASSLSCTAIVTTAVSDPSSAGAEATDEAESATETGTSGGVSAAFGQVSAGCGATFDVPAGSYDLRVVPSGTSDVVLLGLGGTQFEANTFYLVVVTGTLDTPQPFISSLPGGQLTGLLVNDMAEATAETTAEATSAP